MTTATQAGFARLKKVSRASVTDWKNQDRLVMVGNLIDVEKSQEKLLRGSGFRAKGRRADVNLSPHVVTLPVKFPDLPGPVVSLAVLALGVGIDAGEAVMRHGANEALARAVADDLTEKAVRAAADLAEDDYAPPAGYEGWQDHPVFNGAPAHRFGPDWAEIVAEMQPHPAKPSRRSGRAAK